MSVRFDAEADAYTATLSLGAQNVFTMCGWVNIVVDRNNFSAPFGVDSGANTDSVYLEADSDGVTMRGVYDNADADNMAAMTVGTWYFLAVVVNSTSVKLYMRPNGGAWTVTSPAAKAFAPVTMTTFRVGRFASTGEWLNGSVVAVKVWTAALTQAELNTERFFSTPQKSASLAAAWALTSTAALTDLSGNGHNLTGTGAANDTDPSDMGGVVIPDPPSVYAVGTIAGGTGTIAPGIPAGTVASDILLLVCETGNEALSPPTGYAEVTGSPVSMTVTTPTRLCVFWKRAVGGDTAPTVADPGDHVIGQIIGVRDCKTSGDPWDVVNTGTETTVDTSASFPTVTTTVANTLVLNLITTGTDVAANSTVHYSAWTNASLTSVTERTDQTRNDGNGGTIGASSGIKAAAGAVSATTATVLTAAGKSMMTLAMAPLATTVELDGPVTDTVTAGDSVTGRVTAARSAADTATTGDTVARVSTRPRATADTVTAVDGVAGANTRARSTADTVTAGDSVGQTAARARATGDTVTVLDSVTRARMLPVATADTVTAGDSAARGSTQPRATADTVTAADTVAGAGTRARATGDTVTAADTVGQTASRARSVTDTVTAADTVVRARLLHIATGDTVTAGDAVGRAHALARSLADTLTAADAAAQTTARSRSTTDTVTAGDTAGRALAQARALTDTLTAADTVLGVQTRSALIDDTVSLADTVARARTSARALTDTITAGDTAAGALAQARALTDTVTAADTVLSGQSQSAFVTDTITLGDAVARAGTSGRISGDAVTVLDTVVRATAGARALTDLVTLTGTVLAGRLLIAATADTVTVLDAVAGAAGKAATVADSLSFADAATRQVTAARTPVAAVALADAAQRAGQDLVRQLSDQLTAADTVAHGRSLSVFVVDVLLFADTAVAVVSTEPLFIVGDHYARETGPVSYAYATWPIGQVTGVVAAGTVTVTSTPSTARRTL